MNVTRMRLWPTDVAFYDTGASVEVRDDLTHVVIAGCDNNDPTLEHRVHHLERLGSVGSDWLVDAVKRCVSDYLGQPVDCEVSLRGVAIKHGQCINTHTETHESDLLVAFWPVGETGKPINAHSDREVAPTFIVEDPSRYLTDLRLPFEIRHSVSVCPRPGLMVVGPAHLPHNLWPYLGRVPFPHIVAQVKVRWPAGYEERF